MLDLTLILGLPFIAVALQSFFCWLATEFGS